MKRLLLPCLCLIFVFSHAQRKRLPKPPFDFYIDTLKAPFISFKGDSSTRSILRERYDRALDSQYHLTKDYTFEFRLRQYSMMSNFENVFVLTLKQGKWTAKYFDRNNGMHEGIVFTERAVDQSAVNQLWQLLVEHEVLTLPSQSTLASRLVKYSVDTTDLRYGKITHVDMTDGVAYDFSLRTPTTQKHYGYSNPQMYLKYYSNVKEFFEASMLIILVEKFLGQPLKVY